MRDTEHSIRTYRNTIADHPTIKYLATRFMIYGNKNNILMLLFLWQATRESMIPAARLFFLMRDDQRQDTTRTQ